MNSHNKANALRDIDDALDVWRGLEMLGALNVQVMTRFGWRSVAHVLRTTIRKLTREAKTGRHRGGAELLGLAEDVFSVAAHWRAANDDKRSEA